MATKSVHRGARRKVYAGVPRCGPGLRRGRGQDPDRRWCSRIGAASTPGQLAECLGDGQNSVTHYGAVRGSNDAGNRAKSAAQAVARRRAPRGGESSSSSSRICSRKIYCRRLRLRICRRKIYRRRLRFQARGRRGSSVRRVHSPVCLWQVGRITVPSVQIADNRPRRGLEGIYQL